MATRFQQNISVPLIAVIVLALIILSGVYAGLGETEPEYLGSAIVFGLGGLVGVAKGPSSDPDGR